MIPAVAKFLRERGVTSYVTTKHIGIVTTLTASGPRAEGSPFLRYADTNRAAVEAYLEELSRFLDKATVVFWRHLPEVITEQAPLISKKPMLLYQVMSRLSCCGKEEFHELGDSHE